MRESEIETKICKYAKDKGWLVYKFTSPGNRAVPDRIFMRNRVCFFIEFKSPGKQPTKLQYKIINKIVKIGGFVVYIIDNIDDGIQVINQFGDL